MPMDVKQAVQKAAAYVAELECLAGAGAEGSPIDAVLRPIRFAVEGTRFDADKRQWIIEVGFTRKWDQASASPLAGLSGALKDNRTFKNVRIDDATGEVVSYGG